ncbi:hypothetical protein N9Z64_02895 [bacterium]|nr:hypothetical protein [bacterium]
MIAGRKVSQSMHSSRGCLAAFAWQAGVQSGAGWGAGEPFDLQH